MSKAKNTTKAVAVSSAPADADTTAAATDAAMDTQAVGDVDGAESGAQESASGEPVGSQAAEDAANTEEGGGEQAQAVAEDLPVEAAVGEAEPGESGSEVGDVADVAQDPLTVWLNTTTFPVMLLLRNNGSVPKTEPISGLYVGAGSASEVTLFDPSHASRVLDNLATLNDTDVQSPGGLVIDDLPFALTKKG